MWTLNFQMFKLVLEKAEEPEIKLPTLLDRKSKRVPEKHLFLLYWLCQSLWLCGWIWVWVNSGSWWWTGRPGVLRFMGLQRVGHDWETELTDSHNLHFKITGLARRYIPETILRQDILLLHKSKECRGKKFVLSSSFRIPASLSLGTPRLLINLPRKWLS